MTRRSSRGSCWPAWSIAAPDEEEERKRAFDEFHAAHHEAFHELRKELNKLPVPVMLQFIAGGAPPEDRKGPFIQLLHARGSGEVARRGQGLPPSWPGSPPRTWRRWTC